MTTEQKFDRQVIKTLNFVKSLKLNFLSIERIVKAKTDLSLEQKTEVMNLIHKQYNINFKSNLALNPAIKNNNLAKDKFLKKSTIKKTDKIIKTAKKTINGTKTKPIRITTISKKTSGLKQKNNILEATKQKIYHLRNAVNTYNRMGQGAVKWENPYYTNFGFGQTSTKRHKNL